MPRKRPEGMTLVELLVVFSIIGLLVALVFPAVQSARESSRRLQCANNLRQLAIGLQTHVSLNGAFPYGTLDEMSTSVRRRDTWMQQTWPYIEQLALFSSYANYTGAWVMDTPATIKDAVIPTFMCPSDPKRPNYGGGGPYRSGGWGFQGNYVANATSSFIQLTRTELGYQLVKLDGIFYGNSTIQPAHIRDGMSQTLLLSEVKTRGAKGDSGWGDGGGYWGGGQHAAFGFTTMDVPNTAVSDRTYQCKVGDAVDPPCISVGDSYQKVIYARSFHPGGVNAVYADASLRFVGNWIDPSVWKGMATRAGGEPPGDQ